MDAARQLDRDNPWPGLESFEENARDYFHGRETEAEDLLRRVIDAPLTVLFGKSGLGKTSLLNAGLFPRLREKNYFPVRVRLDIRPDAPELSEQLRDGLLAAFARERVEAPPFAPGETLWEYLHRADLEIWSAQNYPLTPVLVLDQFEEVFTLGERLPQSVEECRIDLGDLAENRIPSALASRLAVDPSAAQGLDLRRMSYKLVVTLREDFLPHLEEWRRSVPSLGRVRVRLLPMRPRQALSAVYDTAPHLMDERLADRIVAFVAAAQETSDGGEIEPALLSLFCRGLNERRKQQGAARFDEQLLEGAQQGIIADYYRSCVTGLPDSVSRFIESDLITEKGFRNSYAKDDAVPVILSEEQLEQLINRRLLRVEERYGTARIELTHDLLTRAVMADRDRRRVEEEKAALVLQARRQRRRLLAMAFVALVCLAFTAVALWQWRQAVLAKRAAEEAKTAAVKAQYAATKAEAIAISEKYFAKRAELAAVQERDKAKIAEDKARAAETEAQTQARLAKESAAKELVARGSSEARRMETEARLVFDDSGEALVKATLLSVASLRSARTVDGQISLTRFLGLLPRAPLWRKSVAQPANFTERQRAVAVSPDGARIAVAGASGPVQLLAARTGKPIRSFDVARDDAAGTALAFSPDGAFLVMGCGPRACVIDATTGEIATRLPGAEAKHGDMVWSASFSPDGKQLAMSSHNSGDVLVYDVATWQTTATIHGQVTAYSAAFSPQGNWVATGNALGLQLWRAGKYEAPAAQRSDPLSPERISSIAFQRDDTGLVTAGLGQRSWRIGWTDPPRLEAVTLKDIKAHTVLPVSWHFQSCFAAAAPDAVHLLCGESLTELLRVPMSSAAAAVSSDGRWLFNQQHDGMLAAWPVEAGPEAVRIPLGAPVRSLASAERGGWVAAGTDSGEVVMVSVDSWKERRRLRLPAPPAPVDKVIASSDGRWLAVAQRKSLRVFDAGSGREVASRKYEQDVARAAFTPGDRSLVVVTGNNVNVWETGDWRERLAHRGQVERVRVSPDGSQVAVGDTAPSWPVLEFHEPRTKVLIPGNEFMSRVDEHEQVSVDGVWAVRFSGLEAKLSDVATGRVVGQFDHGQEITSTRFVPDAAPRWLVTAGTDGTLAVWPMRTDDLVREACARLQAILGPQALAKHIADAHAEGSCE